MSLLITSYNLNLAYINCFGYYKLATLKLNFVTGYNLIKGVKGSYHQGDIKSGDSAGTLMFLQSSVRMLYYC